MTPKDYEDYQKNNVKASKSQLKDYIQIYADMAKKLKDENSIELDAIKNNIKDTYPKEIYFTLIDKKIAKIAEEDEYFQGFVINPHSQNFNMGRNGEI